MGSCAASPFISAPGCSRSRNRDKCSSLRPSRILSLAPSWLSRIEAYTVSRACQEIGESSPWSEASGRLSKGSPCRLRPGRETGPGCWLDRLCRLCGYCLQSPDEQVPEARHIETCAHLRVERRARPEVGDGHA